MINYLPITLDTMVIPSDYVTKAGMPVLYVCREEDEDGKDTWQFHCGNGDYSMERMQLVRLDTVLRLDHNLSALASLLTGQCATRESAHAHWKLAPLPAE